ncbi:hypothetical protein N7517_011546 [Penicillium concentricum]|uniref:Uncharacterized protein n=1 Tax=Penicillium concentricum TaxID=293559 RepID=A0A9W9UTM3_9EURO|nr:uncharacterized protein N7517_011546 [Penicillium concentricum]KAJ5356937.1 hypothetical protein N7517_011546 [Penicillium concentricum]
MIDVSASSQSALSKFDDILLLPALTEHESDVPIRKWIDERGRIRIWTANTGAHHRGTLSLDYRLKDVPVIKRQTVKILQRLRELLETLEEVLGEDGGESTKEEDLRILEAQLDEDQNIADLELNESEVSHIFKTIVETVTQLYQISMTISPLADHDRLTETKKLDYVLQAIHGGDGQSIPPDGHQRIVSYGSKVSLTKTTDDLEEMDPLSFRKRKATDTLFGQRHTPR